MENVRHSLPPPRRSRLLRPRRVPRHVDPPGRPGGRTLGSRPLPPLRVEAGDPHRDRPVGDGRSLGAEHRGARGRPAGAGAAVRPPRRVPPPLPRAPGRHRLHRVQRDPRPPTEARDSHIAARDRRQKLLDDCVVACVDADVFSTPYPRDAARAITTICTGVAQWYRPDGELDPEGVASRYGEICRHAAGQGAGSAGGETGPRTASKGSQ
ncbi:hypothetical protein IOD13_18730 [Brevibacterium casei]|nr:hypothetical protein [Brevibacterium casei]